MIYSTTVNNNLLTVINNKPNKQANRTNNWSFLPPSLSNDPPQASKKTSWPSRSLLPKTASSSERPSPERERPGFRPWRAALQRLKRTSNCQMRQPHNCTLRPVKAPRYADSCVCSTAWSQRPEVHSLKIVPWLLTWMALSLHGLLHLRDLGSNSAAQLHACYTFMVRGLC